MYLIIYSKMYYSQTTPEDISKICFVLFFCDSKKLCCYLLVLENKF